MSALHQTIGLSITGLGIIFFSPFAVAHIAEGENYFSSSFTNPEDIARHVLRCDISAFCTGSPGGFTLIAYDGELDDPALTAAQFKIRLGLEVRDRQVCFRDLYDLMDWTQGCRDDQRIAVDDGFYRITAYSSAPPSGILGDHQLVYLHVEKTDRRPALKWHGVPQLC